MIRWCFFIFSFCYILNLLGCTDSVNPITPSKGGDPRTYTWTLDTIYYPYVSSGQTTITQLWGVNDTVVYAVGHSAYYGLGSMWKYDGKKWNRVLLAKSPDGGTIERYMDLHTIGGLSANDIYAAGGFETYSMGHFTDTSLVLHYDGVQWKEVESRLGRSIISQIELSPTSVYFGNWSGLLIHYDGLSWSADTITYSAYPDVRFNVMILGKTSSNGLYIQTDQWETKSGDVYSQLFRYEGNKFTILDSMLNFMRWGGLSSWQSKEGTIYSAGTGGIFRLVNDKWQSFYSTGFVYTVFGVNDRHMFAVGEGVLLFFDGTAWTRITSLPYPLGDPQIWCSETQIFISYHDGVQSYILHGKLPRKESDQPITK